MTLRTPMTPEDIQRAVDMQRAGHGLSEIAAALGRHKRTVQHFIRQRVRTPEQKEQRNLKRREAAREARLAKPKAAFVHRDGVGTAGNASAPRPTAEMMADRDRRISRPFSIAIDLLGEPEKGRSALDKRMAGASA